MTDTAAAQLSRILQLVPQLGEGEAHSLAEIARRMGVDRDVLVRDIRTISERFDVPGGFIEGLTIYLEADKVEVAAPQVAHDLLEEVGRDFQQPVSGLRTGLPVGD